MKYTYKSCAWCGKRYSFVQGDTYRYGSPFRVCKFCGRIIIDKDYHEIAIEGVRWCDMQQVSLFSVLFLLFSIFFSVFSFFVPIAFVVSLPMLIFWICMVVKEVKEYPQRMQEIRHEEKESEKRLSNLDYALALKKEGFKVPAKFLHHIPPAPKPIIYTVIEPTLYTVGNNIEQGFYTIAPKPSLDGLLRVYQDGDHLKSICITKPRQIKLKKNMEIHLYDCDIQR